MEESKENESDIAIGSEIQDEHKERGRSGRLRFNITSTFNGTRYAQTGSSMRIFSTLGQPSQTEKLYSRITSTAESSSSKDRAAEMELLARMKESIDGQASGRIQLKREEKRIKRRTNDYR